MDGSIYIKDSTNNIFYRQTLKNYDNLSNVDHFDNPNNGSSEDIRNDVPVTNDDDLYISNGDNSIGSEDYRIDINIANYTDFLGLWTNNFLNDGLVFIMTINIPVSNNVFFSSACLC